MWPAESIMQSMWPAMLCRFPTPALKQLPRDVTPVAEREGTGAVTLNFLLASFLASPKDLSSGAYPGRGRGPLPPEI